MSFTSNLFKEHLKGLKDSIEKIVILGNLDKATAAELDEIADRLKLVSSECAVYESKYVKELGDVTDLEKQRTYKMKLAVKLEANMNAAQEPAEKASIEQSLSTLLAEIEGMDSKLVKEKSEAVIAKQDLDESLKYLNEKSIELSTARERLKTEKDDLERAEKEKERAEERAKVAESRASGRTDVKATEIASSVMAKRTEELKIAARAAELKTAALKPKAEVIDPNIAAAMAEIDAPAPQTMSVSERLAALKK